MELPIKFPSDADVIVEETSRFRALSPEARILSIRGILATGNALIRRSPRSAYLGDYAQQQELVSRENLRAFCERHA